MDFLPVNMDEAKARGWEQLDFVIVTADAYIDHPSFGTAIISRVLESSAKLENYRRFYEIWKA